MRHSNIRIMYGVGDFSENINLGGFGGGAIQNFYQVDLGFVCATVSET